MKTILNIFTFFLWIVTFGQTKSEIAKVFNFINDPLKKVEMYKPDTMNISTAMLTRERLPDVRRVTTFPKNQSIKHDEYYYNDTKILESNYSYKLPSGKLIGITKQYNKNGQLEYIQDHDKGTWKVVRFEHCPYYKTLVRMKGKVDSLITSTYGQNFFDKYIVWSPEGSAFYKGDGAGATWYDYQEWKPKEFLIRYSIKLSDDEIYDEQIEVSLDSLGQVFYPFDKCDDIKGFEKIDSKKGFVLSKETAIDKAKKFGLNENDSIKAFTFLTWKYNNDAKKEILNGHFTYNVAINTMTIPHTPKSGRNSIEYKFDVYIFNPWTGEYIETQKMKSYREWEKVSGMSTGLLPDK